ncbi:MULTISPECIES: VirK/YbjX family protein [unclassified Paludibacterium]|uniref:VirK/YbjX family protein n=1 Tax=unclassified Paludibacterium TaxID=2618429 RepID=UPI001C05EB28|nr:VirK/YbjX family protein [Paludibacterium sp. B53371]BEV70810.1 VirK/YbjX family protein [Paludibacterium sp. THUN1379]
MPQTAASLLRQLVRGDFSRRDGLDEFKHRFKLGFRSLLTLPAMLRWLDLFVADEALLAHLRLNPRLAMKLHRPYLMQKLNTGAKLQVLLANYQLEKSLFPPAILDTVLRNQHQLLAELTGKDERQYTLLLTHAHGFDKEGELAILLMDPAGFALVTLSFTLCQRHGAPALVIGGLQGPRRYEGSADTIRAVTKAFHGLFPKRVAMEALTVLAQRLGIKQVLAVGKAQHIYNSWRYRKNFEADYDSFWQSLEAKPEDGDYFRLPLPLPRKTMEDIASKKRAEYQRRYTLLDDLASQIATNIK